MKQHPFSRRSPIEPLEARIAPATVVNGTTVQYRDFDGDLVTVKFSKAIFTGTDEDGDPLDPEFEANQVFDFDTGDVTLAPNTALPQQLQEISFDGLTNALTTPIGITVTVKKADTGDGKVDIGAIEGERFTSIVIPGDLGRLDVLNGTGTTLQSLVVDSIGKREGATQIAGDNQFSLIDGNVGKIEIKGDFHKAHIELSDGNLGTLIVGGNIVAGDDITANGEIDITGNLNKLVVGGNLVGGTLLESGRITVDGVIGSAEVKGSLLGGAGADSGQIFGGGGINSLAVKGNLTGSTGDDSGSVQSSGTISKLTVGGNLTGGEGKRSGSVLANGSITTLTVNGSLDATAATPTSDESAAIRAGGTLGTIKILGGVTGGSADRSAQIFGGTSIGTVSVGTDLLGGWGIDSGSIQSNGKINTVTIGRDLSGSAGDNSGSVVSGIDPDLTGDLGKVTVGRDLIGGGGVGSGAVVSGGKLSSATVKGGIVGGSGDFSGSITSAFAMGTVKVTGGVTGAGGAFTGHIGSGSKITSVAIGANLVGGAGAGSGSVTSQSLFTPDLDEQGDIAKVTVGGSVLGGTGADSGQIAAAGDLKQATVGDDLKAGAGARSGSVFAGLDWITSGLLGKLWVKGDIDGEAGASLVEGQRIGTLQVDGSILKEVAIAAWDDISKVLVKGNVSGEETDPVTIRARGQAAPTKTDVAIGGVEVKGNASFLNILAGYTPDGTASNADAQIGNVKVGGNWTAGSVVAGVADTDDDGFGDADDAAIAGGSGTIFSRIASVVIGGTLSGTAAGGDHFGFTAQEVAALKIGGVKQALVAGRSNDAIDPIPPTADVAVREV